MYPGYHHQVRPDKTACMMAGTGESVTYSELDCLSNQGAHLFRHLGLNPGDGITILLPNVIQYLQIVWAAQRSGLYYTPISVLFQKDEIEYIVNNSDARLLITNGELVSRVDTGNIAARVLLLEDWEELTQDLPVIPVPDEQEGAEMIYSSGTTGKPKGVRLQMVHAEPGTINSLVETRIKLHGMDSNVRYLSTAPLYHSAPIRYNLMVTRLGGTSVIMEKFDAETALSLIQEHGITHCQWVPTMFVRLLQLPEEVRRSYDTSTMKYAIHAAAPCPVAVKEQMIDWWGPTLYEYYSGTEANGQTTITTEQWLRHKGSVGKAIHGEIHILDEDGNELPTNETGIIYFANGSDFSYYKDPEKTRQAKVKQGWSTLGDIGYLDEDGYLYLKDRLSFMIISGGVNIYPQEIEDLLITHQAVYDVAVFGIPNAEFGEEVKAVVQLIDPEKASGAMETSLINFCRTSLSHAKCPRSIDFIAELPRHPNGKLLKGRLRDNYWQDHDSRLL